MSKAREHLPTPAASTKEPSRMPKRLATLTTLSALALALLALAPLSASAAPSPWWQVLTGSRPTNLWEPQPGVQEIETEFGEFAGEPESFIGKIEVKGKVVGCMGSETFLAPIICEVGIGFPAIRTAAELESLLEAAFETSELEVTGGPVGGAPFVVRTASGAPTVTVNTELEPGPPPVLVGNASTKVISPGGSGRLVLTITNLGDAPVDATESPVTITDELPAGVTATGVEANAGLLNFSGPLDCEVQSASLVSCASMARCPPTKRSKSKSSPASPGSRRPPAPRAKSASRAAMSPAASAAQSVKVSPEETPFGIDQLSAQAEEEGGSPAIQAGDHPFQLTTTIALNAGPIVPGSGTNKAIEQPALPRNLRFPLPEGLVGNATAVEQCDLEAFFKQQLFLNCPPEAALGRRLGDDRGRQQPGPYPDRRPGLQPATRPGRAGALRVHGEGGIGDHRHRPGPRQPQDRRRGHQRHPARRLPLQHGGALGLPRGPTPRQLARLGLHEQVPQRRPRPVRAAEQLERSRLPAPAGLLRDAAALRRRSRTVERAARQPGRQSHL